MTLVSQEQKLVATPRAILCRPSLVTSSARYVSPLQSGALPQLTLACLCSRYWFSVLAHAALLSLGSNKRELQLQPPVASSEAELLSSKKSCIPCAVCLTRFRHSTAVPQVQPLLATTAFPPPPFCHVLCTTTAARKKQSWLGCSNVAAVCCYTVAYPKCRPNGTAACPQRKQRNPCVRVTGYDAAKS